MDVRERDSRAGQARDLVAAFATEGVRLVALPGWAWAPADRYTQEGAVHVACQRSFARRMTETARDRGIELRMAFEIEWFVGGETEDGTVVPGCSGPAYGMTRVVELSDYIGDVVAALDGEDVDVEQVHPEYAPGQLELSIAAADPVRAADLSVLVRQTIRAVTQRHGLRASFGRCRRCARSGRRASRATCDWCRHTGPAASAAGAGRTGRPRCGSSPALSAASRPRP